METSMTQAAGSALISFASGALVFGVFFEAAHADSLICDVGVPEFYDYEGGTDDHLADCVESGQIIKGNISSQDLSAASRSSSKVINLMPKDVYEFDILPLANSCVSRLSLDVACRRYGSFLVDSEGVCSLPGVYVPPSENELQSWATQRLFGGSWGTCSAFTLKAVPNQIVIGPGTATRIRAEGSGSPAPTLAVQSLHVDRIQGLEDFRINGVIIFGDLIIDNTQIASFSIVDTFVLGNLSVLGSKIEDITFTNVWIAGSFLIKDSSVVRANSDGLHFQVGELNNTSVESTDDLYRDRNDAFRALFP
jgi:hypothetical protein